MNNIGIVVRESAYSVRETIDRLQSFLLAHGATIYARIDQQAEVQKAGLTMPPLEFILFGNPKAGGPIMLENPLTALDLPLKIIAWQDDEQKVWLAYNTAAYLEERFDLTPKENTPLDLEPLINAALKFE